MMLDDDDEEEQTRGRKKKKNETGVTQSRNARPDKVNPDETIDAAVLDDGDPDGRRVPVPCASGGRARP